MGGNYEKGMYNQLMEVMARLDAVECDLHTEKDEHKEDVEHLNQKIDSLTQENQLLRDDNARLKSILDHDSSNTSLPPSSDQKGSRPVNTYNGRKSGGQKGHKGTTLTKAEAEVKIKSGYCRHVIKEIGTPSPKGYLTKYVIDLDVAPLITELHIYADEAGRFHVPLEYRSDVTYGPNVKALSVELYSEGVISNDRIAAFLNAAGHGQLGLSDGSVYRFCKGFSERAQESLAHLEERLLNQKVVLTDATVVSVNGKQNYIRNFSEGNAVVYHAMKEKTIQSMKNLPFLREFTGVLVHDPETALYHFGTGHGECNVHILRYLKKNTEDTGHSWSGEMVSLLCSANRERNHQIAQGLGAFPAKERAAFEERYQELIRKGRKQNVETKHRYAKKEEQTLLNRMEKYRQNLLLFLNDFGVPFDNNMSERDLRKAKNRQKMEGGFRKASGNEMYCSILSIIETLKRREMAMLENIKYLFMGTPAIF